MSIYENKAAEDVIAERQRQVSAEGWTTKHDDEHDTGTLSAAASAYALYAADELNPHSQGDGDYGRAQPEMWPFHMSSWKPEDPRRALVKAGALILAEIERIDRAAHRAGLIQPATVERDEMGFWTHPAWPKDGDEDAIPKTWFAEQGLKVVCVDMESDGPADLVEKWFDQGDVDCTPWEPSRPTGDGWFIFSIHDTEDGPICVWVRHA